VVRLHVSLSRCNASLYRYNVSLILPPIPADGPFRGGRAAAVAGVPSQPLTYYFGATGGGVWKTTDGGANWRNVSDGFFGGSIGAVAVSEWDPNVSTSAAARRLRRLPDPRVGSGGRMRDRDDLRS
jgi:hypothetical protein